jgi:Uri superfamily endonuclease
MSPAAASPSAGGPSPAASRPPAASPRLYVVLTYVPRRTIVTVGSLGPVPFERGWYAYVGSAARGRRARVARHLAASKPLRWHADYLSTAFPPRRAWIVDGVAGECDLAAGLAASPGAERRPPRFGAGDCRCPGHHVHFSRRPRLAEVSAAAGPGARVRVFRRRAG